MGKAAGGQPECRAKPFAERSSKRGVGGPSGSGTSGADRLARNWAVAYSAGKIGSEHSQIDRGGDFPHIGPMFFIGLPAE